MKKQFAAIALLFCLTSLALTVNAQQPDNLKPMYGGVAKTPEYKKIDDKFRDGALAQYGSKDSAVKMYIDVAWRYFYNKDVATAMKRFNQVWLLNEDCPDAYFGFAALTEIQGKQAEADRYYATALKKDKTKTSAPICYHRIADCAEQVGNIPVTTNALLKLAALRPGFAYPYKKLGYLYMQSNQPENALAAYNTAIALDSTDALTYRNRGYFHQLQHDFEKAISDYSSSIQADPAAVEGYVSRAMMYVETGNMQAAKTDMEKTIMLEPKSGELRRMLAMVNINLSDKESACANLKLAKALGDTEADAMIRQYCQ